jgi:hypothetical protein
MAWEGTGITPFFKELIIMVDPFLDLGEVSSPFHLTKKLPFVEFEGFILFEIGAVLNRSNSKTQVRKSATVGIGDSERDLSLHGPSLKCQITNYPPHPHPLPQGERERGRLFWHIETSQFVDLCNSRLGIAISCL